MSIYTSFVVPINLCTDNLIGTKLSRSNDISALTAQLFASILYIQQYPLPPFACHVSRFTVQCFYSKYTSFFFFSMFHWRLHKKLLNIKCFVIFRRLLFHSNCGYCVSSVWSTPFDEFKLFLAYHHRRSPLLSTVSTVDCRHFPLNFV